MKRDCEDRHQARNVDYSDVTGFFPSNKTLIKNVQNAIELLSGGYGNGDDSDRFMKVSEAVNTFLSKEEWDEEMSNVTNKLQEINDTLLIIAQKIADLKDGSDQPSDPISQLKKINLNVGGTFSQMVHELEAAYEAGATYSIANPNIASINGIDELVGNQTGETTISFIKDNNVIQTIPIKVYEKPLLLRNIAETKRDFFPNFYIEDGEGSGTDGYWNGHDISELLRVLYRYLRGETIEAYEVPLNSQYYFNLDYLTEDDGRILTDMLVHATEENDPTHYSGWQEYWENYVEE